MNRSIDSLTHLAHLWCNWVWSSAWQSAVVVAIILMSLAQGRRWNAPLRYAILVVALIKFAMPPLVPAPTGLFSWAGPSVHANSQQTTRVAAVDPRRQEPLWNQNLGNALGTAATVPTRMLTSKDRSPVTHQNERLRLEKAFEWQLVLMLIHVSGAVLILVWFGLQASRLVSIRRRALPAPEPFVGEVFSQVVNELGLSRGPDLLVSTEISSPVAFGIFHPTILLPETLVARFTHLELRTVLAHELAHLRRRDLWVNALELILVACWWFHPFIWALRRALRRTREDCCDDLLLARGLTSNDAYCDVLVRAARELAAGEPNCTALGLGENLHPLGRRLRRIMDKTLSRSAKLSVGGASIAVIAAWVLLPGLRSEERPREGIKGPAGSDNSNADNTKSSAAMSPDGLEHWFSNLRWVGEDNAFFDDTRRTAKEIGRQAVPFLLSKIGTKPAETDDARAADTRRNAVMALGLIAADLDRTIPKLVEELEDDANLTYDPGHGRVHLIAVSSVAADALGQIGPAAVSAVPALTDAVGFGNSRALRALARIAPNSTTVLSTLTNALHDFTKGNRLPLEGEYRLTALNALEICAKSNPAALAEFAAALDDGDPRFRSAAAAGLVNLRRENIEADRLLTHNLEHGTLRQRTFLAAALAKTGNKNENVHQTLLLGLRAKDPEFMLAAIEGVASFQQGAADVVPILAGMARTEAGELRIAALRALGPIRPSTPEAVDAAIANLDATDEMVRVAAMSALSMMGEAAQKAEPQLLDLLHHPASFTRQSAATTLGSIHGSGKAIPALKAALNDQGPGVASSAMFSLAKFPEIADEMIPVLTRALERTNSWAAASALGQFGPKAASAVPALIEALRSPGMGLRNNAANALGRIGPAAKSAIPTLELALKDSDGGVRNNAAMALWKIDRRTNGLDVLLERLRSDEFGNMFQRMNLKQSRLWDMKQLTEIGPQAKGAVPVLQHYLNGPDDDLRAGAQQALNAIEAKDPTTAQSVR